MVFKKMLSKEQPPENMGGEISEDTEGLVKRYYLEFPQLEGHPTHLLENSLTIGSETGDIVLSNDGIAPNHCTINLNHDVLSIIDHGSEQGTLVNGNQISPGKMVFLNPGDKVTIGSIAFDLIERAEADGTQPVYEAQEFTNTEVGVPSSVEEHDYQTTGGTQNLSLETEGPGGFVPPPVEEEGPLQEGTKEHTLVIPDEEPPKPKKSFSVGGAKKKGKKNVKKNKKKNKKFASAGSSSKEASNAFLRVLAIIFDGVMIAIIHNLASQDPAYNQFLTDLPNMFMEFATPIYNDFLKVHVDMLFEMLPELNEVKTLVASFYREEHKSWIQLGMLLILFRMNTAILFGATLGQCMVGIRAEGSFLRKRLLAIVRSILGFVFLPIFWLVDAPTLFSKRSLKEVLSFTRLHTPSTFMAILSITFFTPILTVAILLGPALRGMNLPQPMEFTPMRKVELGVFDESKIDSYSSYFKLGIPAIQVDYILPKFKFTQKGGKKSLTPSLIMARGEQNQYELKLLKNVSLAKLLNDFVAINPMASLKYPQLNLLVTDVANTSGNFKTAPYSQIAVAQEFNKLLQGSMSLLNLEQPELLINFVQDHGPFIGAFVEFRNSIESLMGEAAKNYQMKQLGNSIVIIGDYSIGRKVIHRILPLNSKNTKVYEISYTKGDENELFELIAWNSKFKDKSGDALLSFVDILDPESDRQNLVNVFQNVSQTYYDLSKTALMEDKQKLYTDLQQSLQGSLDILIKNSEALKLPERASQKLSQNLGDLLKALKERDFRYFGISAVGALEQRYE